MTAIEQAGSGRAGRWGADLPADEEQARERLLRAAEACYVEHGPNRTKMTDIARKAGVHRTTVYAYFPNRDAVLAASFVRAVAGVLDAAEPCWRTAEPFLEQVVQASLAGMAAARSSPTMRLLIGDDALGRTFHVTEHSEIWRSRLAEALGRRIAAAADAGDVRDDIAPEIMAHWVTRMCFSLIAEPGNPEYGGDEGLLRAFLTASLAPRSGPKAG